MASSQVDDEKRDLQLKHLWFVRVLAMNTVVLVSNIYDSAKQSSGSLKSTIDAVESAVTSVVGPVYEKFKGVPDDLLVFLDKKVDEGAHKFNEQAPPVAKKVALKAQLLAKKASKVAHDLVEEAKVEGPLSTINRAGELSKGFAIGRLTVAWYKANQHPAFRGVAVMAIPTAAYLSEKYNHLVKDMSARGFRFFNYVPLIPVEEMGKAYKQVEGGDKKENGSASSSESDEE